MKRKMDLLERAYGLCNADALVHWWPPVELGRPPREPASAPVLDELDRLAPRPWTARDSRVLSSVERELFLVRNVDGWSQDRVATLIVQIVNAAGTPAVDRLPSPGSAP